MKNIFCNMQIIRQFAMVACNINGTDEYHIEIKPLILKRF